MYGAFGRGPGGRGRRDNGFDGGLTAPFDQIEKQFRDFVQARTQSRAARGDVRAAVLALLSEEPMHGYQIIHEIDKRSAGAWKPSAGSVYPTLQMLADEGLVSLEEQDGKKVYSLTETGRSEAEAASDKPKPWESAADNDLPESMVLPRATARLVRAVGQVVTTGNASTTKAVTEVIDEARRKVYSILAQD